MSTANHQSPRLENVQIVTSHVVPEFNNADTNADSETPASGLFLQPSENVPGRATDITGYIATSATELGKVEWSDPDGLLSLDQLSDVTITDATTGDLLVYDGTVWVNTTDVPALNTTTGATTLATGVGGTLGFFDATAVVQQAAIADPAAADVAYDQANLQETVDAVTSILAALRTFGLIAT